MEPDEFHGEGGTYEVREGKRVQVTPPTQPHADGDRARNADGKPIDEAQVSPDPAPATSEQTRDSSRYFAGGDTDNN